MLRRYKFTIKFRFSFKDPYKLDAYLPKYNIVIEVDEYSHRSYDFIKRLERCTALNAVLKNPHYVRFDPYDTDITIYQIIGKIHRLITHQLITTLIFR